MAQLLRSNSVAVSTSHDFEDKATITAFCNEKTKSKTVFKMCEPEAEKQNEKFAD